MVCSIMCYVPSVDLTHRPMVHPHVVMDRPRNVTCMRVAYTHVRTAEAAAFDITSFPFGRGDLLSKRIQTGHCG